MAIINGPDFQIVDLGETDGYRLFYLVATLAKETHFLDNVGVDYTLVQRSDFEFNDMIIDFNPEDVNKLLSYFGNKYTL